MIGERYLMFIGRKRKLESSTIPHLCCQWPSYASNFFDKLISIFPCWVSHRREVCWCDTTKYWKKIFHIHILILTLLHFILCLLISLSSMFMNGCCCCSIDSRRKIFDSTRNEEWCKRGNKKRKHYIFLLWYNIFWHSIDEKIADCWVRNERWNWIN